MLLLGVNTTLIILSSLLQLTDILSIAGIKPNLVLVFLIISAMTWDDWLKRLVLTLVGAVLMKFSPGTDIYNTLFIIASLIGMGIYDKLPWAKMINGAVVLFIATLITHILTLEIGVMFGEIIYNIIVFLGLYAILQPQKINEKTTKKY